MSARLERRPAIVWLVLILLTLLSVLLAEHGHLGSGAIVAMFAIAAIKGEFVISSYMEIGRALLQWRVTYRIWLVTVPSLLALGHLIG